MFSYFIIIKFHLSLCLTHTSYVFVFDFHISFKLNIRLDFVIVFPNVHVLWKFPGLVSYFFYHDRWQLLGLGND
jgi:hypothetical protein